MTAPALTYTPQGREVTQAFIAEILNFASLTFPRTPTSELIRMPLVKDALLFPHSADNLEGWKERMRQAALP